jgi:hypothetical protein
MSQTTSTNTGPLTVVLVHGAFADASSWTGVIERLTITGIRGLIEAQQASLRALGAFEETSFGK